jgi:hypothetical protein
LLQRLASKSQKRATNASTKLKFMHQTLCQFAHLVSK